MKHRVVTVLLAAGLLGGCSSSFLDDALEFPSGHKDAQATPEVPPEASVPTNVAVAKTAPFVVVPEAPPLSSTGEAHQSLRAGTAMVPPPPAPPPPPVVALPDITPPPPKAVARATPPAAPIEEAPIAPPPNRTVAVAPAPTVAAPIAQAPVAPKPKRTAAVAPPPVSVAPPPVAVPSYAAPQPSYTPAAPAPVAQPAPAAEPSYTAVAQAPVPSDSAPDSWCVRVAKSAQIEAADQGFDAATQQRRAMAMFKQCSANAH